MFTLMMVASVWAARANQAFRTAWSDEVKSESPNPVWRPRDAAADPVKAITAATKISAPAMSPLPVRLVIRSRSSPYVTDPAAAPRRIENTGRTAPKSRARRYDRSRLGDTRTSRDPVWRPRNSLAREDRVDPEGPGRDRWAPDPLARHLDLQLPGLLPVPAADRIQGGADRELGRHQPVARRCRRDLHGH